MTYHESSDYGKLLESMRALIILKRNKMKELKKQIKITVEEAGFHVFLRAEGYALMKDESVGILGLPHIRVAFAENVCSIWIRDPYSLKLDLLNMAGYSPRKYYEEILNVMKKLKEVLEGFKKYAEIVTISIPE